MRPDYDPFPDVSRRVLQILFALRNADMQSTSDQAFVKNGSFDRYRVVDAFAYCVSGGVTVACAGGIFDATAGGGNAVVAAGQSWTGLSAVQKIVKPTLAALCDTDALTNSLYLKLSTGSTAAARADVLVLGWVLR